MSTSKTLLAMAGKVFKAIAHGLGRFEVYGTCGDDPCKEEYWKLISALDHLERGVETSWLGHSYLDRIGDADPAVLNKALQDYPCSHVDVARWITQINDRQSGIPSNPSRRQG